jgi:putative addiction module component (TIGR02574 family)
MALPCLDLEQLTADERITLIGQLWNSLDAAVVAPITPALVAELTRREAEVDAHPEQGEHYKVIEQQLRDRLR